MFAGGKEFSTKKNSNMDYIPITAQLSHVHSSECVDTRKSYQ